MYENRVRPTGHGFAKKYFFSLCILLFPGTPARIVKRSRGPRANTLAFFSFLLILCGCGGLSQKSSSPLAVMPGSVSFGSVTVGQSATTNLTLQNRGIAPVAISSLNLTSPSFSVAGQSSLPVTIAVGATYNVAVKFNPTATGQASGSLDVESNQSGTVSSLAVGLSGTGISGLTALTINSTGVSFGTTALNSPVTQDVMLTASGGQPVTVTSAALSGTGFSLLGATMPLTLNSGQSATLSVQFDPTSLGPATGQLLISSASLANGATAVALSGTGVAYEVALNWNAPSGGSVTGYNVYRAEGGSANYQLLNASVDPQTSYKDPTVQSGGVYDYIVKSVDFAGTQSEPSNTTTVTIP